MKSKILELFLTNNELKFSEIQKLTNIRSNKLSFYLTKLVKSKVLLKENKTYKLSPTSEELIPYFSENKSTLPVILIHIGNKKEVFLYKREKRPFKGYLGLPGGRLLVNENIPEATIRIMKGKFNVKAKLSKINSISLEKVKKNNKTVHSFLLIFVTASVKDKIKLTNVEQKKKKLIKSDYQLLKNDLNLNIKVKNLTSKT